MFYGNGLPEDQAHALLTHAADRGVTFWDTSNRYGKSMCHGITNICTHLQ